MSRVGNIAIATYIKAQKAKLVVVSVSVTHPCGDWILGCVTLSLTHPTRATPKRVAARSAVMLFGVLEKFLKDLV